MDIFRHRCPLTFEDLNMAVLCGVMTRPCRPAPQPAGLTFSTGSSLDEEHRWLLQLLGSAAHPLQLTDVPVRHSVAAAHRLRGFAHAQPVLASPPHRRTVPHSAGDRTLQTLSAHRVPELPGAAAGFALSGRAHRAAVAGVEGLTLGTVGREPRTQSPVTASGTSDNVAAGGLRISRRGRTGQGYGQQQGPEHD